MIDKTEFISKAQFPSFWLLISYYDCQIYYSFPDLGNDKFIRANGRLHHTWRLLVNEHLSQRCRFHWYFCNFISKTSCDNMSDTLTVSYLSFNSKVFIISWQTGPKLGWYKFCALSFKYSQYENQKLRKFSWKTIVL